MHVGTDIPNADQDAWFSGPFAELYLGLKCWFHVVPFLLLRFHATKREYALTPLETIRDTGPALSFSLCVFDLVRGGQHYGNGWRVIRE